MIPEIHIEDYAYPLEDSRIAKYPLPERDASKLLHYRNGKVSEYLFRDLPSLLPELTATILTNTITMRLSAPTGEILRPIAAATASNSISWTTLIRPSAC